MRFCTPKTLKKEMSTEPDMVKAGQVVVVMETMKMENPLITTIVGQVKEICLQKGAQVATGAVILLVG